MPCVAAQKEEARIGICSSFRNLESGFWFLGSPTTFGHSASQAWYCRPMSHRVRNAVLLLAAFRCLAAGAEPKKPNGPVFGSPSPTPGALRGSVYRLPRDTGALPNFAAMKPVGTLYTTRLDYQLQNYGDEWFGIEYTGRFYLSLAGDYYFQLTVDDGAEVIIDGKTIVSIDGVHPVRTEEG